MDLLKDEIKKDLKGLREVIWYQCDHMKFANMIDSKFKQLELNFNAHVSERIKSDEEEKETTASDEKSDKKSEKSDTVSENEKESEHEVYNGFRQFVSERGDVWENF